MWRDRRVVLAPVSHRRGLFVEGGVRDHHPSREAGAEVVAVSADSLESHHPDATSGRALGGCPFPLVSDQELEAARQYGVVGEDGRHSRRAVFVIDRGGSLLHQIPWFHSGVTPEQFMGIFQAVGAV